MDDFAAMRDQRPARDFIFQIEFQLAFFDEVGEERRDVFGIHLTGMVRDGRGEVGRSDDGDVVLDDRFATARQYAARSCGYGACIWIAYDAARPSYEKEARDG